ncbi:hypothetical protein, partial [Arthrobacter sp. H14]|uniref:hypothetical protein n=1 Tax=Arthrobacter sp. H14 TaxID=1312959 RepID=UPI001C1E3D1B
MDEKMKLAGILLGGYLLGRTKKGKLALTMAGGLAGKKISGNKGEMLGQLNKLVESSPEAKKLMEQITGQLTEAARNAVLAGATRGIESVGTNLQNRTERLNALKAGGDADEQEEE